VAQVFETTAQLALPVNGWLAAGSKCSCVCIAKDKKLTLRIGWVSVGILVLGILGSVVQPILAKLR
jgi:hypothetical protein